MSFLPHLRVEVYDIFYEEIVSYRCHDVFGRFL